MSTKLRPSVVICLLLGLALSQTGCLVIHYQGAKKSPSTPNPSDSPEAPRMTARQEVFGTLDDGRTVYRFTLANQNGMAAKIMTLGGIVTELHVPDRSGQAASVVLGFDNLEQYKAGHPVFGAIVGRVANRIAEGRFTLDGQEIQVTRNAGKHHIHGGAKGFDKVLWEADPVLVQSDRVVLRLRYRSVDGEEGYPGNLDVVVTYTLTSANELRVDYEARTDKPTVVNLTNHSYFNLAGGGDVLGHELMIQAEQYTLADEDLIPTGVLAPVEGTPLDFRQPTLIGARIDQLKPRPGGYDHNYVLKQGGGSLALAARVVEPASGRVMEVLTTEPGVQLYTANHMDGRLRGVGDWPYGRHAALCLETQHYPDSVNHPEFPSTVLRPGGKFTSTTVFQFKIRE